MPSPSAEFVTRPIPELLGRHPGYGFAGQGVATAIGNYTETDVDLSFPGGLLGLLDLTRTYNSLSSAAGITGRGWATTFGASLTPSQQGLLHRATGPVVFHDVDGGCYVTPNPPAGSPGRRIWMPISPGTRTAPSR